MRKVELHAILAKGAKEAPNPHNARIKVVRDLYVYVAFDYFRTGSDNVRCHTQMLTEHRTPEGAQAKAKQLARWVDEQDIIAPQVDKDALIRALYRSVLRHGGVIGFIQDFTERQRAQIIGIYHETN